MKIVVFDFNFKEAVLNYENVAFINFIYDIQSDTPLIFSVRPFSSYGSVYIWDENISTWVSGHELWTAMPILKEEMKIKVESLNTELSEVHFEIQQRDSGTIYTTEKKKVWSSKPLAEYVKKINEPKTINSTESSASTPTVLESSESRLGINTWVFLLVILGALITYIVIKSRNANR